MKLGYRIYGHFKIATYTLFITATIAQSEYSTGSRVPSKTVATLHLKCPYISWQSCMYSSTYMDFKEDVLACSPSLKALHVYDTLSCGVIPIALNIRLSISRRSTRDHLITPYLSRHHSILFSLHHLLAGSNLFFSQSTQGYDELS